MFPQWDEVTDDGTNWSNDRLNGSAYIVIFPLNGAILRV